MAEQSSTASCSSGPCSLVYIKRGGGTILLHAGHEYRKKRGHKSGLTVWECTKRPKSKCKSLMRIKGDSIVDEKAHTCTPDFMKNEIEQALYQCKQDITTTSFPSVPTTYNLTVGKMKDAGLGLVCNIPKFSSVKSSLYRHKNSTAGVSKLQSKFVKDVEDPPSYKHFLLADYTCGDDRILIFASNQARDTLCEVNECYGDGTFKSCPSPFDELYTIHGDLGSTVNHTQIIPLVYALMSSRDTKLYVKLFTVIKAALPNWNPQRFKVDYEKAVIKALTIVFPTIEIKGCFFHYNKAIWAKGRELGLTKSQNPKNIRIVALSAVLPLLPENEIMPGWNYIIRRNHDNEDDSEVVKFIKYMKKQWLQEDFIPVWCAYGEQHRTTNALEAWHSKLNRAIGKKNPNLMQFLKTLQEDASFYTTCDIRHRNKAEPLKKRLKKFILTDEFIQEAQLELVCGEISVGQFLEIVRH